MESAAASSASSSALLDTLLGDPRVSKLNGLILELTEKRAQVEEAKRQVEQFSKEFNEMGAQHKKLFGELLLHVHTAAAVSIPVLAAPAISNSVPPAISSSVDTPTATTTAPSAPANSTD